MFRKGRQDDKLQPKTPVASKKACFNTFFDTLSGYTTIKYSQQTADSTSISGAYSEKQPFHPISALGAESLHQNLCPELSLYSSDIIQRFL